MNKYAKALVAAVLAGGGAYESAINSGASSGHALIGAVVAAVVTGLVTWGVPNDVATELQAVGSVLENTVDHPTTVLPVVK